MPAPIDLARYRRDRFEARVYGPWRRRFGEVQLCLQTRLVDLDDPTLYRLAQPGDESSAAFYEFIAGVRQPAALDEANARREEIRTLDIHLFLADQMRFELMCRLHWIEPFQAQQVPLVELVQRYEELQPAIAAQSLAPAPEFPSQIDLEGIASRERLVRLRQLIPQALTEFAQRLAQAPH